MKNFSLSVEEYFTSEHSESALRTADAFPVVTSLPLKNNVCEPERQKDFRDVKPF